jgi:hypothetical protein
VHFCFNDHSLHGFCKIGTLHLHGHLLGCAGQLQETENMMKAMPHKPHVSVWKALLSTCRIHGNVGMGEHVANQNVELADENA